MAVHQTALVVSLTAPTTAGMLLGMADAAAGRADMAELRLDCLARRDAKTLGDLIEHRPLPVIVTCRPVRQGGRYEGPEAARLALLAEAARLGAEYVDVEDDVPASDWPAAKVIVSHHDFRGRPADLDKLVKELAAGPAAVVKVAFAAAGPEDALAALAAVRGCAKPAMVIAMGECGVASRILAPKVGAFGTFASLEAGAESAPGQAPLATMKGMYRWDSISPATQVFGVVGCPVAQSLSPVTHNAFLAGEKMDAVYVPLRVEPSQADFARFLRAVREAAWADVRGLSVTIPHKEHALAAVGAESVDELSRRIGAINTVRLDAAGRLRGWNTDYAGAIDALCEGMGIRRDELSGRHVAVLGAGGAARAVVAGLDHYGAIITIYNRTLARAAELAGDFGADARPLADLPQLRAEVLINCTSIGMYPRVDESPVPEAVLPRVSVVFDTVYNPVRTLLLRQAAEAGCRTVGGLDMFLRQAEAQFELWTGRAPSGAGVTAAIQRQFDQLEHLRVARASRP